MLLAVNVTNALTLGDAVLETLAVAVVDGVTKAVTEEVSVWVGVTEDVTVDVCVLLDVLLDVLEPVAVLLVEGVIVTLAVGVGATRIPTRACGSVNRPTITGVLSPVTEI